MPRIETAFRPFFQNRRATGPGVKPDVQDVRFLTPVSGPAMRALEPVRHDVREVRFKPVIAAGWVFFKAGNNIFRPFGVKPGFSATLADKRGDGHSPEALSGNAPVRAIFHHVEDALFAPGGNPLNLVPYGVKGFLSQVVLFHGNEPLGGCPENNRLFAAPAMRVGVGYFSLCK